MGRRKKDGKDAATVTALGAAPHVKRTLVLAHHSHDQAQAQTATMGTLGGERGFKDSVQVLAGYTAAVIGKGHSQSAPLLPRPLAGIRDPGLQPSSVGYCGAVVSLQNNV